MRRKKRLRDILEETGDRYWEEDSKLKYWKNYYFPFYKSIYAKILDLDELTYSRSGKFLRVIAKVKNSIKYIAGYSFGGDVIINLDNMPEEYRKFFKDTNKYQYFNLGILPQQGNLQGGKKKSGNDWRLDVFLKAVNNYFSDDDETILIRTKNRNNRACTVAVLNFLGSKIDFGEVKTELNNEEKIFNFCKNLYGISRETVKEFLRCPEQVEPQVYYELIKAFWKERELSIGHNVTVKIDRPMGSYQPKHKDIYYPINYGYIEGIMAPDGEEQDAYVLGVNQPVDEFSGIIIAIIHRYDDVEEKWVVAPENVSFSKEEIEKQVYFQEQYFRSEIRM